MASICNYCKLTILDSDRSWYYHHFTPLSLQSSASQHCMFCAALNADFEALDDVAKKQVDWPLYRWSIRSLGRMRSSKECVSVTFRVIPRGTGLLWKQRQKNICIKRSRERRIGKRGERQNGDDETQERGDSMEDEQEADYGENVEKGMLEEDTGLRERTFYLFPEKDFGEVPKDSHLGTSTNPRISGGKQIKTWFQRCHHNHQTCPRREPPKGSFVPTRLLDIGLDKAAPVRVVETKSLGIQGPYVSLSHCWGSNPTFEQLLPKTYAESMGQIPWERLSRNFQEAIEVARFLEIRYIWIDSLCIIQGEEGDFTQEASLMHEVYRNSYCNLVAAASGDSEGGLFRDRKLHQVSPSKYTGAGRSAMLGEKTWVIVRGDIWNTELLETPIYKRGWVFQERMLSPRILHFTKHQIFWDCAEMSACETIPSGLLTPLDGAAAADRHWRGRLRESGNMRSLPLSGANDDSLEYFWQTAVQRYTSCDLTDSKDKLVAMWGIAKLVRDILGEEYGAGLWAKNLEEQLAWRVIGGKIDENLRRDNPSWSWASMNGTILLHDRVPGKRYYAVRDHQNQPIAFQLVKGINVTRPSAQSQTSESWKQEIAKMEREAQEREERRKTSNSSKQDRRKATTDAQKEKKKWQNEQPSLMSKSIPIHGYVSRGSMKYHHSSLSWTLDIGEDTQIPAKDAVVEAFPDVVPTVTEKGSRQIDRTLKESKSPYFVVLALSQTGVVPSLQQLGISGMEKPRYSGIGLMLVKSAETQGDGDLHFKRIGAVHFKTLSDDAWNMLRCTVIEGGNAVVKSSEQDGLKFWLN